MPFPALSVPIRATRMGENEIGGRMGLMDEWGDALVEEGLREAADTFFGTRKALDDEIDFFKSRVGKLADKAREIRSWFAGLNCLLGGEDNFRTLFDALGVKLADESLYSQRVCSLQFRRPRGFTRKGLYAKTVWEVYEALARQVEAYMHGVPFHDPAHPGRVLVSLNHAQVFRHCADINERIRGINESNRPSESLGFVRRMNPGERDRENITGGGGQTWNLDRDLAFAPLDFDALELPVFPDLPMDDTARQTLSQCCGRIFSSQREHVETVFNEVFSPENKNMCVLERS